MAQKIRKALIPAAGFGTRFLPQTKAMPKEMMPLVDKPIIQRVVEELVDAGIETIVIVTGWNKRSIEDHFDNNTELEQKLESSGKMEELAAVRKISDMAEFVYLRQKGPAGNATPILNVKHIMRDDPFLMFWGDDFIDAEPSRAKQLIEAYEKYESFVLATGKQTNSDDFKRYGYVGGEEVAPGVMKVEKMVEKPKTRENSPSDYASLSGYVVTPDIYKYLEERVPQLEEGQELVYIEALQDAIRDGVAVYGVEIQNAIYRDTGNKLEYLKTVVDYGLMHEDIADDFKEYLRNLKLD